MKWLISTCRSFFKLLGVDRAIGYTVFSRIWQSVAGLLTIIMLSNFLSPVEQGFYFTFSSLLSIQVFVELGLSLVLVQFASHEIVFLTIKNNGLVEGPTQHKERLASLVTFAIRWYGVASLVLLIVLIPFGYYFFNENAGKYLTTSWRLPWILLVCIFSINLSIVPVMSILEGCGKVREVALVRIVQEVLGNSLLWTAFAFKLGLLSAVFIYFGRALVAIVWLSTGWRKTFLLGLLRTKAVQMIDWKQEIFPFQWKIGLSWVSGYLIFQLFNPILFKYHGAEVAGQMGITLAAFNGLTMVSMAWVNTKVPQFGQLIAKKEYAFLDSIFFNTLKQSLFIIFVLCTLFVVVMGCANMYGIALAKRFLPMLPLLFMSCITVVNHVIFSLAAYLRAHKQEPFLVNSMVCALLMSLSTYVMGRWYGAVGVTAGYFCITVFVGLGWSVWIFTVKRREWHALKEVPECI